MNFIDYLKLKQDKEQNLKRLNESFASKDIDKVHDLMLSIFKKKISDKVFKWDWQQTVIDGKDMKSFYFIDLSDGNSPLMWSLNYLVSSKSADVYSISFFDTETSSKFLWGDSNKFKATLEIDTMGTSVAYFIPIICHIVKNGDYGISKEVAMKLGATVMNEGKSTESRLYKFGAVSYNIFENLSNSQIEKIFKIKTMNESTPAQDYRWKVKAEQDKLYNKYKETKDKSYKDAWDKVNAEYREILAAIKGGAQTIEDLSLALKKNIDVEVIPSASIEKAEQEVEKYKDPEEAFTQMKIYVKSVLKGMQPGVILCGAPGVGKTYRIMQQLKAAGYKDGYNLDVIKGKCTPRQLYLSLYQHKDKGDIVVIDDADALVGPKAPEDCINMLKAALDSTSSDEGRKVSYRVSGILKTDDDDIVPKTMYYNGGVIVITNYSAGQLDTALKGRTFIQSLEFTTSQLLTIIERLMPNIDPDKLTMESKIKALDFLKEMNEKNESMEISIRTFGTCAKLYCLVEDEEGITEDIVRSMIREQMENQYARGGKKY